MSIESARAFLARMNSDTRFRTRVENLELDDQQHFVEQSGYSFTLADMKYAAENPLVDLNLVVGGAQQPGSIQSFESEFIRSWKDAG